MAKDKKVKTDFLILRVEESFKAAAMAAATKLGFRSVSEFIREAVKKMM